MIWCPLEPTPLNLWLDFVAFGLSGLQDNLIFRVDIFLLNYCFSIISFGTEILDQSLSLSPPSYSRGHHVLIAFYFWAT